MNISPLKSLGLLLYPIGTCPTNPYSSLPALAGFLRNNGAEIVVRDLNVEAYNMWLHNGSGHNCYGNVSFDMDIDCSDLISDAVCFMQGKKGDFFDPLQYRIHRTILNNAINHISNRYSDVSISWGGYSRNLTSYQVNDLRNLLQPGRDPVIDFLDLVLVDEDLNQYNWIGLSIAFSSQLVPALLTSIWIRERGYRGRLLIGGACAQFITDLFIANPDLFDVIDALIVKEGESALLALSKDPNIKIEAIPNSISRNSYGVVKPMGPNTLENVNKLITPDYSDLPMDLYFTPTPVLVTLTSRGCYYNKCVFCVPSFGHTNSPRLRSPLKVANDLKQLKKSTGSCYFFFSDDCIPPSHLMAIWNAFNLNETFIWQTEMRFDPALTKTFLKMMKLKGCAQLIFGLESANQRVLNKMVKGTQRKIIDRILRDCEDIGINVNLQIIIGFPTETHKEAIETLNYLIEQKDRVASFSMEHFRLIDESSIMQSPQLFGISNIEHERYGSVCSYSVNTGLTSYEAEILSDVFYTHLIEEYYPVNTFFLDGPMGAHALLYAGKGKLRDMITNV